MGQSPSITARQDNASTRTLHSTSINTTQPLSFFRRISQRLHTHPSRRFRRRNPAPSSSSTSNTNHQQGRNDTIATSIAPSTSSSVRRATVAATQAAAAETSPLPPLPFLNIDPHPSSSSAASTTSAISNSSELSQMISEIISSALLSSLSQGDPGDTTNNNSNAPLFHYIPMPVRYQHQVERDRQHPSPTVDNSGQQHPQTILPILIVEYHTGAVNSPPSPTTTASPTHIPTSSYLRRRPHSGLSTSSSLATLQSMPFSIQSNRTTPHPSLHHHQRTEALRSSSSSTVSTTANGWAVYRMASDTPTYEDLLWLSNFIGPARPITTTQQVIDATLPTRPWSDETSKSERCLVCLDDFTPKQPVRVLKCSHVFHVECVDRWLVEAHNSCPICRSVPCAT